MTKILIAAVLLATAGVGGTAHAQAAPDPVKGKQQFGQCRVCHNIDAKAPDGLGPNLWGAYGSKAATRRTKFAYSPALKASKLTWDDATLDKWITDPGRLVKGTKMEFIGIARKPVRDNIIAYLKTLK